MDIDRVNALLAHAKRDFRLHALEQRSRLQELAAQVGGEGGEDAMLALHQIAHQLYGTGGTLGFDDLSSAAQALEAATVPASVDFDAVRSCHAALDAALVELQSP
jgi:HPt (histidine-containing phosphotransfer) domain-containing protein